MKGRGHRVEGRNKSPPHLIVDNDVDGPARGVALDVRQAQRLVYHPLLCPLYRDAEREQERERNRAHERESESESGMGKEQERERDREREREKEIKRPMVTS